MRKPSIILSDQISPEVGAVLARTSEQTIIVANPDLSDTEREALIAELLEDTPN